MSINQKVRLKSFLGKKSNKKKLDERENYWILIGQIGKIIESENENFKEKVLVLFDTNLDELNLFNHNPIKNTLWIFKTDLEIMKQ